MREMKDSGVAWIGEIPNNWDIFTLKSIFSFGKGLPITKENLTETGVPVISYGQIHAKWNTGVTTHKELFRFVDGLYLTTNPQCLVQKGDFIIADTSEDKEGCGNCAYIDTDNQVFAGYHTITLNSKKKNDNKYLAYLFLTDSWRSQIRMRVSGVKLFSISKRILGEVSVILPPLSEQQKIASLLNKKCTQIDTLISNQEKQIEKLKAYKQSLITEVVTKGLNPDVPMKDSGVEWIGEIPEGWDLSTVLRKIHFEGGSQPALTYFIHEPKENYVRLIQNRDYRTDDYITYVPKDMVTKFCSEDDIMVGRYGPPIFVLHRGLAGAYNVAIMKAVPLGIDKEFMYYFLQNSTMISYIESFSLRAAGQSGVNPDILKKYPMCVPPLDEQKEIADYLDKKCSEIDRLIAIKQQKIEKLQQYKKSIIYEYVTGKKEVE